jgi:hypothetical protein
MSLSPARKLLVAAVCGSVLAGVAVADSGGATASDTVTETSVATTVDTVVDTSVATTPAAVDILPPDEPWSGLTRGEWDARKWQWMLSMPEDVNPYFDATGDRCGYGQSGPVFFLPGTAVGEAAGGEPFTCVIAEGTAIYVRVAGTECSTLEPPPFFGRNEDELRACATADLDGVTNYQARINGQDVADLDAYRIGSPLFTLIYPENNIVGVEPGVAQAVSESYSFIIAPPPPGQYEIASTARYAGEPATRPTATVTIIVEAPQLIEPPPTT